VTDDHESLRLLLGGYLLGGLDDTDQDRLDAHLLDCAECRTELARLGPVPDLLRRMPATVPAPASPSPERIDGLLRQMRAERSRSRRAARMRWAAAAAVVAVLAVGTGILVRGTPEPRPPIAQPASSAPAPADQLVTATFNPAGGTSTTGAATLTARTWGVSVALDMTGLPGDGPFVLRVTNADGHVEQACIWGRTPSGRAKVTGASSMPLPTVRSVSIADRGGHVLATAPLR
jgi:anti-sigma factor RsiW